ncbi:MAG: carboxypeptidase-like regulatory domain-containing protein [Psychroflexus sp.]
MKFLIKNYIILIILFSLTGFSSLNAQQISLIGKVIDSARNPISNTNIIATPLDTDDETLFSISDQKGRYRLKLSENSKYLVEITHLGFKKISDTIQISEDKTQNFTLQESTESLEEVLIRQEMAVIVKEDTITYRTDQFKTGEERKLRDVLKKLPGVDVDRDGNVKVNGKSVNKLMVDGKTFFTGDEKLGVNNIPADAVDEVEALDNYNEVSFLKDLSDSNQMALNIKLKKGVKDFIFGNIEAGVGVKERYLMHPTLFYYSPKTAVNVIGDFNNIGEKSFTMRDYIDFEGGFSSILDGSTSFGELNNSDFAEFLNQDDFVYQKNDFGAGSISQEISPKLQLEAFTIINKGKTKTGTTNNIAYLTQTNSDEFRQTQDENNLLFSLNKLKLRYQSNNDTDLAYDAFIKNSNGDAMQNLNSLSDTDTSLTRINQKPENFSINQEFRYNKQFSYKHTSSLTANYKYNNQKNSNNWLFNQQVFTNLIPFQETDDLYQLMQHTASEKHQASINLKHYWVLNNFNHIYPIVGMTFLDESFVSKDYQKLENGNTNDFQSNNFNNNTQFRLTDYYIGFQYKIMAGNFIFKPGIIYHSYFWKINQYSEQIADKQKKLWLPELNINYELSSSEELEFDYHRKTSFTDASQYASRLRLLSFNQLYRGNENLENQLYHSASLNYKQFNMYRGVFLNATLNYSHREKSIRNQTEIEGIDQISTSIYTDLPENTYSISGNINKRIPDFSFSLGTNFSFSDYSRIINNETLAYQNNNYSYNLKVDTRFDDLPNFEVGYRHSFSRLNSDNIDNEFMRITPFALVEYDFLEDFIFKFNYDYNYFKNQTTDNSNRFEIAESSLFYGKEDSAWSFEISATNIFDVDFKRENSVNEFIVSDRRIFLQPRTVLLKLIYKL